MLSIEKVEILLIISAIVALAARRIRLPYTVGLVIAGAVMSALGLLTGYPLTKEMIFRLLLPPLIFEAAFFIHWKELRKDMAPVLVLASIGVMLAAGIVGAGLTLLFHWPLEISLLFGALIAATDPVSVIAMFKEMKIEGRLRLLVESESLFNDGVAAVLFSLLLLSAGGTALTGSVVLSSLLREVGGGLLCGGAVAGLALFLAGRTDDHLIELTFTTVAAFGSFLLAEHFHCSGVLAVLTAGMMIGNLGHIGAITDRGHEAVGAFWEFAAFLANSIVFLLIGIREHKEGAGLLEHFDIIGAAILVSLIGRAFAVYVLSACFSKSKYKIPTTHQHILFWGGLKGALSLALAIGLPDELPFRAEIVSAAFGVVAFSIIVQGISMPVLMKRLKVT